MAYNLNFFQHPIYNNAFIRRIPAGIIAEYMNNAILNDKWGPDDEPFYSGNYPTYELVYNNPLSGVIGATTINTYSLSNFYYNTSGDLNGLYGSYLGYQYCNLLASDPVFLANGFTVADLFAARTSTILDTCVIKTLSKYPITGSATVLADETFTNLNDFIAKYGNYFIWNNFNAYYDDITTYLGNPRMAIPLATSVNRVECMLRFRGSEFGLNKSGYVYGAGDGDMLISLNSNFGTANLRSISTLWPVANTQCVNVPRQFGDWIPSEYGTRVFFNEITINGTKRTISYVFMWKSKDTLKRFLNQCGIRYSFDPNEVLFTPVEDFTDGSSLIGQPPAETTEGSGGTGDNSTDTTELENPGIDTFSGGFNKLYAMTPTMLNNFSSYLWSSTFVEDIKLLFNNPLEGVISVKLFPFSLTAHDSGHVGASAPITVGNVVTTANGQPIQSGYNCKLNMGSIKIDEYFGNFMDYDPYTSIGIYLPYIGIRQLPTSDIMTKTLAITYIVDLMTGGCTAAIKADDVIIGSYDGIMGVDVPITGSNAARFGAGVLGSVASGAAAAGTLAAGAATGGAVLAAAGAGLAISTAKNIIGNKRTIEKSNASDSQNGFHMPNYCYLIITRPEQQLPSGYERDFGRPCNITYGLSQLQGYTECYDPKLNNIAGATESELNEIKQLLETGVIIR